MANPRGWPKGRPLEDEHKDKIRNAALERYAAIREQLGLAPGESLSAALVPAEDEE
jgi:hypothetical protein